MIVSDCLDFSHWEFVVTLVIASTRSDSNRFARESCHESSFRLAVSLIWLLCLAEHPGLPSTLAGRDTRYWDDLADATWNLFSGFVIFGHTPTVVFMSLSRFYWDSLWTDKTDSHGRGGGVNFGQVLLRLPTGDGLWAVQDIVANSIGGMKPYVLCLWLPWLVRWWLDKAQELDPQNHRFVFSLTIHILSKRWCAYSARRVRTQSFCRVFWHGIFDDSASAFFWQSVPQHSLCLSELHSHALDAAQDNHDTVTDEEASQFSWPDLSDTPEYREYKLLGLRERETKTVNEMVADLLNTTVSDLPTGPAMQSEVSLSRPEPSENDTSSEFSWPNEFDSPPHRRWKLEQMGSASDGFPTECPDLQTPADETAETPPTAGSKRKFKWGS